MGKVSDDFERFLQANYPDDWRRVTAPGVTDDVVTAIMSRHAGHYQVWKEIPEWVKNNYQDRIPSEVLNGNEQVKEFVAKEVKSEKEEEKQTNDILNFSVMALAAGYAVETVATLSGNKRTRQHLLEAYGDQLPPEIFAQWLETRQSDIDAIKKDWQERQPEKYLLHLVKSLDREQKRVARGAVTDETEAKRKIKTLEKEIKNFVANISTKEDKLNMVDYLRGRPQQMALKHLSSEVLESFTEMMRAKGIKIEPTQNQKTAEKVITGSDSLTASLKKDFSERSQIEALMRQQAQYIAPNFVRQTKSLTRRNRRSSQRGDVAVSKADKRQAESSI